MYCKWVVETVKVHMKEPEARQEPDAAWCVMELMLPLILNVFPDLCRLDDQLLQLVSVCIQRYMRDCVVLKPRESRFDQTLASVTTLQQQQQNAGRGVRGTAVAAGASAEGGVGVAQMAGQSRVNVLSIVKKLIKALLLLSPETYLALSPELQTAWCLIETEPNVREIDVAALKSVLRKEPADARDLSMSVAMPWADDLRKATKLAEECESDKLLHEYVDLLDGCCRRTGGCDVQKLKDMLSERERERERLRPPSSAPWYKVFQEHCRARILVRIVCSWAVSHCREHIVESIYIAASILKGLSDVLTQVFNVEADAADVSGQIVQETLLCGSVEGVLGGDTQANDFPLQGYLEAFLSSFVPEKGLEEAEMQRLESLVSELIRSNLLCHDAWLHCLISKGVFLTGNSGRQVCLSICLSICLSVCLSIWLSI